MSHVESSARCMSNVAEVRHIFSWEVLSPCFSALFNGDDDNFKRHCIVVMTSALLLRETLCLEARIHGAALRWWRKNSPVVFSVMESVRGHANAELTGPVGDKTHLVCSLSRVGRRRSIGLSNVHQPMLLIQCSPTCQWRRHWMLRIFSHCLNYSEHRNKRRAAGIFVDNGVGGSPFGVGLQTARFRPVRLPSPAPRRVVQGVNR